MTTFDHDSLSLLARAMHALDAGFDTLPDAVPEVDPAVAGVLDETARRLADNYPYQHPLYMGQMLKPPHAVARLSYALAMCINPNNHALDGGRASSAMEKEAVAALAAMFGWPRHLGHLCGGGTMANFEALWVAREENPGRAVAASAQAHYTHPRLSAVLGVPFRRVPVDARGGMDVEALDQLLLLGDVGTVVVTLGSTAAGAVDPLDEIAGVCERHGARLHVDAAYGGYYTLAGNLGTPAARAFAAAQRADSLVIDPHKHGMQPYGCGSVLFADPAVGRHYRHDSPYTYFTSADLHLGEISLECSRAGASAVALWSTMQMFPLERGGRFAAMLEDCREAALALYRHLEAGDAFRPLFEPELDIVCWAVPARTASASSARARAVFDAAARHDLHLAMARFPRAMCEAAGAVDEWDEDHLTCLRACVMKPEHRQWMPQILDRLEASVA